jgi:dipeptidyl aminopeptidase/acylaminoacyl peptidase
MRLALYGTVLAAAFAASAQAGVLDGFRYNEEVQGAANADRIAWIDEQNDVTTLWTAKGTGGPAVKVAQAPRGDGQPLNTLSISATGKWIAWQSGDTSPTAYRAANPDSLTPAAKMAVWAATPGGAPCRIADGQSPSLPANADRLAFKVKGDLWIANLSGNCGAMQKSAHLALHARTPISDFVWSPDGSAVAIQEWRGTYGYNGSYSLVGIYRLGSDRVNWMAPSFDRDVAPSWSPDGKHVAFLRLRGISYEHAINEAVDRAVPFEVMVADVAAGTATSVWQSPGADSDFRQWNEPTTAPIRWLDSGHLLLYSEHSGWQNLYRIDLADGKLTDLTPGKCESEFADVSPNGQWLYVSSNCRVSMQRSLYKIDTHSGATTLLTKGDGVFTHPSVFAGGIVFRSATNRAPQTVAVLRDDGKLIAPEGPATGPDPGAGVVVTPVHFTAADGMGIDGQLFQTPHVSGKQPAIIFVHGGPERQMLTDSHYWDFYAYYFWMNRALAAHGYTVLSINYRLGVGYGRDFRRPKNAGPFGMSEYGDVLAGAKWLQKRPDVDPARIGIWGQSYGGYLTGMALSRNSDIFKAGVAVSAVTDNAFGTPEVTSMVQSYGVEPSQAQSALTKNSSPIGAVDKWKSPVLIASGDDDPDVPVEESVDLASRLRARNVHVEELMFPDEQHGFVLLKNWDILFDRSQDFFDRFLRRTQPKP